jgi:hypothetical protein
MLRHKLNRQERTEPRSADDVLAVHARWNIVLLAGLA